jgi:hypothetical protein
VPQDARTQVALAAVRIDEHAIFATRHRVDREVAAQEILLERHVGRGVEGEALVARRGLALGAGERVLLVRLGVQEDGKVRSDGTKAATGHLLGRGADDDVVAILDGQAQELVAHGAAYDEGLHAPTFRP